jgi:hypothetical protein
MASYGSNSIGMNTPMQQAPIVINVHIGKQWYNQRLRNSEKGEAFYKSAVSKFTEVVCRGDVLMLSPSPTDSNSGFDRGSPVYNNLNGIKEVHDHNAEKNRKRISDGIVFAGVATADTMFDEKGANISTIAAQFGGIATVFNTSTSALQVNDLVILEAPDKDLTECESLPVSAGPDSKMKIRPLTKKFEFSLGDHTRDVIEHPPTINQIQVDRVITGNDKPEPDLALHGALTGVAGVGIMMVDFVGKRLSEYINVARTAAGVPTVENEEFAVINAGAVSVFGANFRGPAFVSAMLGCPWISALGVANIHVDDADWPVDLKLLRTECIAEFRHRLKDEGCAFGTPALQKGTPSPFNPFGLWKTPKQSRGTLNNVPHKPEFSEALSCVESLPVALTAKAQFELLTKLRRVMGRVVAGGSAGAAMDVLLTGTQIPIV